MKRLFAYIFFGLWSDISWSDYNRPEIVGPRRTEFQRLNQILDQQTQDRAKRMKKLDEDIVDLTERIAAVKQNMES